MLSDKAVEAIQASAVPSVIEVDGKKFISKPGAASIIVPPDDALVSTITTHTLTGFSDFLKYVPHDAIAVQIVDPTQVVAFGQPVGRSAKRSEPVRAEAFDTKGFNFGRYMDIQDFIIGIQAHFVPSSVVEDLLKLAENVTLTDEAKLENKVVQKVTTTKGVSFENVTEPPRVVMLAPFRTFPDIKQPISPFVLRFARSGQSMQVALFQTDDLRWKIEAIQSIKNWLSENERLNGLELLA